MKTRIFIAFLFVANLAFGQKMVLSPPVGTVQNSKPNPITTKTAQGPKPLAKSAYVFNPNIGKYTKMEAGSASMLRSQTNPFVIVNKDFKWVLEANGTPAHFAAISVKDKEFLANKKTYTYPVKINSLQGYPYYKDVTGKLNTAPSKEFSLSKIKENQKLIGLDEVRSDGLDGDVGRINVYYFKKLKMGALSIGKSTDYIIVTDTLHLTQWSAFNNVLMGVQADKRPFVKIIANTILYESPLNTILMGESDIVLCSSNVQFLSKFGNLNKEDIRKNPPPILYAADATTKNHHYFSYPSNDDQVLLNRLNMKSMRNILDVEMNLAVNSWQKDKLVDKFQTLRKRTNGVALASDPAYQSQFAGACREFDTKFADYKTVPLRTTNGGLQVLSILNFDNLPIIKYYGLPTQAEVIPLQNDTTSLIGTIKFQAKGDVKLNASIKVKLTNSLDFLSKNQAELDKYGIQLQNTIPQTILTIQKQPLKIGGRTMGEILPISNGQANFEINLPEETKTLLEIFPKGSTITIPIDFTIKETNQIITKDLTLILDKNLLKKLDYNAPFKSFDVFEKNSAIKEIKVQSNVSASLSNEGALDYVEVALEMASGGKSTFKGPFTLSSYNTVAASTLVPFLALGTDLSITVSGRAIYENGVREITPFVTNSEIITIDEQVFKKQP